MSRITTQVQFRNEHVSYHKLRIQKKQREARGEPIMQPEKKPILYLTGAPVGHNGGVQPKTHASQRRVPDTEFVSLLLQSGIPAPDLDSAFGGSSCSRFNTVLKRYWEVPRVAVKLRKLFGGKQINNSKFKRVKPIFLQLRG